MLQGIDINMKLYRLVCHLDSRSSCSSSSSKLFLFIFLFLSFCFFARANTMVDHKRLQNISFPALLMFGDSIVDTGNNNYILTLVKCNFRPYGLNFPEGVPTGRFCDGKIPSDILAELVGIKETLPAYLDPKLKPEDLITGVGFASGGSGFDPLTPILVSAIPMSKQLSYFEEYMEKLKEILGEEETNSHVEKSLFFVVAGSDDIANTYYGFQARRLRYDISEYTSFLADSATSFVSQLHAYGARKIGVTAVPPLGCMPSQRTLRGGLHRHCSQTLDFAVQLYNLKLSQNLHSLSKTLKSNNLVYIDIYTPMIRMMKNPEDYDFDVASRGCCGSGYVEVGPLCNHITSYVCNNVSAYLFWDSFHPTERAYRILTQVVVDKYIDRFFD